MHDIVNRGTEWGISKQEMEKELRDTKTMDLIEDAYSRIDQDAAWREYLIETSKYFESITKENKRQVPQDHYKILERRVTSFRRSEKQTLSH